MASLFGEVITVKYRSWTSIPIKLGEIAMPKAAELADLSYQTSVC